MKYNPQIHNRQSMRLKGYDYGSEGLYFITICTQDRNHLFGNITNGEMNLNDAGQIVKRCWLDIPAHFPHVKLHNFVIMPNHIHGIIEITENVGIKNLSPDFKSPIKTVGSIVRGFKIGVTIWMRQNTFTETVWQRGYYDHIIQNYESYFRISEYINKNSEKWEQDKILK